MEILDLKFYSSDLNQTVSIRYYLKKLLTTLWSEGEGFSGERPFGKSGWQYDIYAALVKGGYLEGKLDAEGYVESVDTSEADKLILYAIRKM